eukprot:Awhi_evm1s1747
MKFVKLMGYVYSLKKLERLTCNFCPVLTELRDLDHLVSLTNVDLKGCFKLKASSLDPSLSPLAVSCFYDIFINIKVLELSGMGSGTKLFDLRKLRNLVHLETLELSHYPSLKSLEGCEDLITLKVLNVSCCISLSTLEGMQYFTSLNRLDLTKCTSLKTLDGLQSLQRIDVLILKECAALESLKSLKKLTHATHLNLSKCYRLHCLCGLDSLVGLGFLNICDCKLRNMSSLWKNIKWIGVLECDSSSIISGMSLESLLPCIGEIKSVEKIESKILSSGSITRCTCEDFTTKSIGFPIDPFTLSYLSSDEDDDYVDDDSDDDNNDDDDDEKDELE